MAIGALAAIALGTLGPVQAPTAQAATPFTISASNAQQNAQQLNSALTSGQFDLIGDNEFEMTREVQNMANGTSPANCQIDNRILQILLLTLNKYGPVKASDLSRNPACGSGITPSCPTGYTSPHCRVPAKAVDFTAAGGTALTGNSSSIPFLKWIDTVLPYGSRAGQSLCRPSTSLTNITNQFDDRCNHQHIDLENAGSRPVVIGSTAPTSPTIGTAALYQTHTDGAIFQSTGPCTAAGCTGWQSINGAGSSVTAVDAHNGRLYMLRSDQSIWEYTGTACGSTCTGWRQLNGPNSGATKISAGTDSLYMLRSDGAIFKSTGQACASTCSGWTQYNGGGSGAEEIAAGTNSAGVSVVNMRRSDGSIWQSTGPCGPSSCTNWAMINGPGSGAVEMSALDDNLFIRINNGAIFKYTQVACTQTCSGWAQYNGAASGAIDIYAGQNSSGAPIVNMLRSDGSIWQSVGVCGPTACNNWSMINGPGSGTQEMTGTGSNLFIRLSNGSVFKYNQVACTTSCTGWVQYDGSSATNAIAG